MHNFYYANAQNQNKQVNQMPLNQNNMQYPYYRPRMPNTPQYPPRRENNQIPYTPQVPTTPPGEQTPLILQGTEYIPGYLKTQIGQKVRVEFLLGTGPLIDRTGTLVDVGAGYIILQPVDSDDLVVCDLYSIKFVNIIR